MKRNTKFCDKCNSNYSLSCFSRHYEKCDGKLSYCKKINLGLILVGNEIICKFCKKECKNANSQRNHSRLCKLNPDRQKTFFETNKEDARLKHKKYNNQYTKAKKLGLPKPTISEEAKQLLSAAIKNRTPEQIKKYAEIASKTIREKVAKGEWHTSLAKKMHYNYKGFDLHGLWELKYAQYLDNQNIKWSRCVERFPYIFENKSRHYTPDFYLPETDEYIEIKGYKTEKDEAKWLQFPKKLKVLLEKNLKELNII